MRGKVLLGSLAAIGMPLAVFLSGPRPSKKIDIRPINLPADLDAYLSTSEAKLTDIIDGADKNIRWASDEQVQTDVSLVYFHGFSATRQEVAPLCDILADSLNANVYYTRLAGHGRGDDALGDVGINDWIHDAREALQIGRRLGRRVILIGTSTGATLSIWLTLQADTSDILANVVLSPNFGPKDQGAAVAMWPWGVNIIRLAVGDTRSWEPANEMQERFWNTRYPVKALVPMMTLVDIVDESDFGKIVTPTLTLYSRDDEVIRVDKIEEKFDLIGSPYKNLVRVDTSGDGSNHVLAGDILSPNTTVPISDEILEFLKPLL